jgi:hypothetical protein
VRALVFSQQVDSCLFMVNDVQPWDLWAAHRAQQVAVSLTCATDINESPGQHLPMVTFQLQLALPLDPKSAPPSSSGASANRVLIATPWTSNVGEPA